MNEQMRAQNIRKQYTAKENNKIEQLEKLDCKVKNPGRILATVLGIVGALVMGTGMSMVMVWGVMQLGILVGLFGMVLATIAYPVYVLITNKRKKQYASKIFKLSDELIQSEGM